MLADYDRGQEDWNGVVSDSEWLPREFTLVERHGTGAPNKRGFGEPTDEVLAMNGKGQVVGGLTFYPPEAPDKDGYQQIWISNVMVSPEYRNQGVGYALLDYVGNRYPEATLVADSVTPEGQGLLDTYEKETGRPVINFMGQNIESYPDTYWNSKPRHWE